ncbi:MAG: bacillithiol biosynthesis deacetylase BshB1 [Anaerolineae bacterium]|nr:bacillithiol biosynthesis deacetylase BshB1 [Anaerolineae bacterium]
MTQAEKSETMSIMAFGAHADDIELGCGGTLIKLCDMGQQVILVDMTRGELSTRGTVESRQLEAAQAAAIIGAAARENLGLPDGHIAIDAESKRKVVEVIRKYRPQMVLVPYYRDRHPDHVHASELIYDATFMAGLASYETGQPNHRPVQFVYYMGWYEFQPTFVIDITDQFDRKMAAIYAYSTQFKGGDDRWQQTRLTSPQHDWMRRARMAHHGSLIGKKYGEAFLIRGQIEVDSPLDARFTSF